MTSHSTRSNTEPTNRHSAAPSRPDDRGGPTGTLAASMRQLGRRRVWIASAAVFLVFAGVFFASSAPFAIPEVEAACGQQAPDMRFFTSANDITSFLDACGPSGRDTYRNMQVADLVYPAVVGLFLASSLALVIGRLSPRGSNVVGLASIPLVSSSFDYVENMFAWFALARYPNSAPTDALLGYASAAKTATAWASGILLLGALALLGVQLVRRRVRPIHDDPTESRSTVTRALPV
jgi:hypothetical protein